MLTRRTSAVVVAVLGAILFCPLTVAAQMGGNSSKDGKPTLWLVSAGISDYNWQMPLMVAHKDAIDITAAFRKQQGTVFGKVRAKLLTNSDATAGEIVECLGEVERLAQPNDFVILYLSGHGGDLGGGRFVFCAYDKFLPWQDIKAAMRPMPTTRCIVILDTCHAASAAGGRNLTVICSSKKDQYATEDADPKGNGHWTKIFLKGMTGEADANGDGLITLDELTTYCAGGINRFSGGEQQQEVLLPESPTGTLGLGTWQKAEK